MNKRTLLTSLSLLALICACGGPGDSATVPEAQPAGATSADIGNHVVHFSAQSTDQLPPAIAREYNIVRSKNRAMLNVSVLRKPDNLPVTADVSANTANLTGQLKNVTLRKIEERGDKRSKSLVTSKLFTISATQRSPIVKYWFSISASNRMAKNPPHGFDSRDSFIATEKNPIP